ncbi:MAG: DUF1043 family protein [Moraxellaceae bacterium]|nr:DUF1043 family protein [Moraxellaceae bacterium]HCT40508.1 hypothetical protein [Moraxellaceae bacterium]
MGWLVYLIVFALGGLGGWLLAKSRNPDTRVRELEAHLTDLQGKYDHYQDSVTQHFATSAQLTNALTTSFRELHQHVQQGAQSLCSDSKRHGSSNPANAFISLDAPRNGLGHAALLNDDSYLSSVEPPRDYATKKPSDKGTLDEDFGFRD